MRKKYGVGIVTEKGGEGGERRVGRRGGEARGGEGRGGEGRGDEGVEGRGRGVGWKDHRKTHPLYCISLHDIER